MPEFLIIAAGFGVYNLGRLVARHHTGRAFEHAHDIWWFERWLHLPNEQHFQEIALRSRPVIEAANYYYAHVHFPLTAVVLIWLLWRRYQLYRVIRTAFFISTGAALVIHFGYPLAPPRMMHHLGFVDTGLAFGQSVYGPPGADSVANQYAAMPSLHVGWAILVAIALIQATSTRWRWWWILHPVLTSIVVVVTGNHYWLDGIVGAALVLGGLAIARRTTHEKAPPDIRESAVVA